MLSEIPKNFYQRGWKRYLIIKLHHAEGKEEIFNKQSLGSSDWKKVILKNHKLDNAERK
jgi:hypothetical protein